MKKWSYFDVLTAMHREQINKLAAKLSNSKPGSPAFLSAYKRARSKVEKTLPESLLQRYHVMAKEWSEKPLPPMMQQQYVYETDSSGWELIYFFALV